MNTIKHIYNAFDNIMGHEDAPCFSAIICILGTIIFPLLTRGF